VAENKREAARAETRLDVRFGVDSPDHTGKTRNISAAGLFVQTSDVIQPGTTVLLEVIFPDRTFELKGVVAWAKKVPPRLAHLLDCGMGIRFTQPPEEFRSYFEEWRA
jgi:uncharacterized protein (TIGR02266 family)